MLSASLNKTFLSITWFTCAGGAAVGDSEEPARHELRQAEPLPTLLLREGDHAEGRRREIRLQVRL